MFRSRFIAVWLLLCGGLLAQTTARWKFQAPIPTARDLYGLAMLSPQEAWVTGDNGILLHTTDGGATWIKSSLASDSLRSVFFFDAQQGWIAGNGVFDTKNGGGSWAYDGIYGTTNAIFFIDAQNGWGATGNTMIRSIDGGKSWSWTQVTNNSSLIDVHFVDTLYGWAVDVEGRIHHSQDGGQSWSEQRAASGSTLSDVHFFDRLTGFACGNGDVLRTTDGGASWQPMSVPAGTFIRSVDWIDRQRAVGVGYGANIVRTTDGGQSWTTIRAADAGPLLWDIDMFDDTHGMTVGDTGRILVTDDGGLTWETRQSGGTRWTHGLDAVDTDHAWAANDGGEVLYTTDGGELWHRVLAPGFDVYDKMLDVDFIDRQTGWAVGEDAVFGGSNGIIVRSTDGGRSWQIQKAVSNFVFENIEAIDASTAYAQGSVTFGPTVFYKTTNGGQTWFSAELPPGAVSSMDFLDASLGWTAGGRIYKTMNGGQSWTEQSADTDWPYIYGISFADADHGWAVGSQGLVLHTANGGQTWTQQSTGVSRAYLDVHAVSSQVCWIVGGDRSVGRTSDGGQTWKFEPNNAYNLNVFEAVYFLTEDTGWVGGTDFDFPAGIRRRDPKETTAHPLRLVVPTLERGRTIHATVDFAQPNETVHVLVSTAGVGSGSCFFQGSLCLGLMNPVRVLTSVAANADGRAELTVTVPTGLPGLELGFQALALRGTGPGSVLSNTVQLPIRP